VQKAVESLEAVLRDVGGRIYPVSSLVENIEFFLVAAIVILGLRAFFVQPFKIPTNSMWPSYYGMTQQVFQPGQEPGRFAKLARLATLGASNYSVTAPVDGEVRIPVFVLSDGSLRPAFTERSGRSMLIFPSTVQEYVFLIGGERVKLSVPAEWAQSNYDDAFRDTFFKDEANLSAALNAAAKKGTPPEQSTMTVQQANRTFEARVYWISIGQQVRKGDKLMSFDILTGDLLFVDRFTYNFFPPKVGQGFVFRTDNIHSSHMARGGEQIQQYYIKRLVGTPGDTIEIKPPELWRNGRPIEGSGAFGKNARKEGLYPGYTNPEITDGLLSTGGTLTVPDHNFFAMGDNSPRSEDSRFWGYVPEKDVVGRPLFIYYPLTSRWGPAR
jgi:signal peptidase I